MEDGLCKLSKLSLNSFPRECNLIDTVINCKQRFNLYHNMQLTVSSLCYVIGDSIWGY